jgi:hypothetical protein
MAVFDGVCLTDDGRDGWFHPFQRKRRIRGVEISVDVCHLCHWRAKSSNINGYPMTVAD